MQGALYVSVDGSSLRALADLASTDQIAQNPNSRIDESVRRAGRLLRLSCVHVVLGAVLSRQRGNMLREGDPRR